MKKESVTKQKILITGISGFTGLILAKKLKNLGAIIHGIDRKSKNIYDDISVHDCDILNYERLKEVISRVDPDFVFHLAGDSSNLGHPLNKYSLNIIGTENILKALVELNLSVKKIIISSSAAVYGNINNICSETDLPEPITHYGISKLGVEKISRNFFEKLPIIITRPFNYTGLGQDDNFLIPKIIKHFKNKSKSIELGNLDVYREFNSLEFVIDCYVKLIESKNRSLIVNICSGKTYSVKQIISLVEKITNHKINICVNKSYIRANDIKYLKGNTNTLNKLIEIDLGKNNLQKTLNEMLDNEI